MVRKAKNFEAIQQLAADRKAILDQLRELDNKVGKLEFKIEIAGFNGRKVNFEKLNEYFPQLDSLYATRNEVYKEAVKLNRRLDRVT